VEKEMGKREMGIELMGIVESGKRDGKWGKGNGEMGMSK